MSKWCQTIATATFVLSMFLVASANAEAITLSGTISYDGSSVGDTLYVAAVDTLEPS